MSQRIRRVMVYRAPGSTIYEELIQRVRYGMTGRQISQTRLARLTGVPQGNISMILAGKRPGTNLETWDKLLKETEE